MNRILIVLLVLVALGAGGFYYWDNFYTKPAPVELNSERNTHSAVGNPLLAYVPANTPFFSGSLEPFPVKAILSSYSKQFEQLDLSDISFVQPEDFNDSSLPRGQLFAMALFDDYINLLKAPEVASQKMGLGEEAKSLAYMVGSSVVFKLELSDWQAFNNWMNELETKAGYRPEMKSFQQVDYKNYNLDDNMGSLIMATTNQWLTIAWLPNNTSQSDLAQILEVEKPVQSLAQTGDVERLINKHKLLPISISYLNHQSIAQILTNSQSTISQQLTSLNADLSMIQSNQCKTDINKIASLWPKTVVGYREFDVKPDTLSTSTVFVIENKQTELLGYLKALRGYLPEFILSDKESAMSIALGLNVDELFTSVGRVQNMLVDASFECAPLKMIQQQASGFSINQLSMFSGFLGGVSGVSATIYDMETQGQMPTKLDALVTLTASSPQTLLTMASSMQPMLAMIELPADGEVNTMSAIPGIDLNIGVEGEHVKLYAGDFATKQAATLKQPVIGGNGILAAHLNFEKMLALSKNVDSVPMRNEQFDEMLASGLLNMDVAFSFDVTSEGFEFISTSEQSF